MIFWILVVSTVANVWIGGVFETYGDCQSRIKIVKAGVDPGMNPLVLCLEVKG